MDLMELGIAIKANGESQAMATLKRVEGAGKQSAAVLNKTMSVTTEQSRVAWQKSGGDFERFKQNLASVAATSGQTAKAQVQAQQQVAVATQATTRTLEQQRMATDALRMRVGMGAIAMAGALEMMARQGKVTGESLRQLVVQGSLMATMYGPQGAIIGAVGVAGVALFSFFTRAQNEAKKLREENEKVVASIMGMDWQQAQGVAVAQRANELRLQREIAALEAGNTRQFRSLGGTGSGSVQEFGKFDADIARKQEELRIATDQRRIAEKRASEGATAAAQISVAATRITEDLTKAEERRREGLRATTEALRDSAEAHKRLQSFAPITAPIDIGGVGGVRLPARRAEAPGSMILPAGFDPTETQRQAETWAANMEGAFAGAASGIAMTFTDTLAAGFAGGFDSMGQTMLAGLGSIFIEMGKQIIMFSKLMLAFQAAMKANPILAGPVGIAVGVGLIALGASLAGAATGGGGGGSRGGYGGRSAPGVTTYALSPQAQNAGRGITPMQPITFSPTIIGENDPRAQRTLFNMMKKAAARGI